jgi:hypothetical protein
MSTVPNVPRCHYVKTNGLRCGSPSLRHHRFCYFHQRWHQQRITINSRNQATQVELPLLESALSIQVSITQVLRLLLSGKIEPEIAKLALYGLQIAVSNEESTKFEFIERKTALVVDPAALSRTGVGVDAWEPSDFPAQLEDTPDSTFTPDADQPVYAEVSGAPVLPDVGNSGLKKPSEASPEGSAVIPELHAVAEENCRVPHSFALLRKSGITRSPTEHADEVGLTGPVLADQRNSRFAQCAFRLPWAIDLKRADADATGGLDVEAAVVNENGFGGTAVEGGEDVLERVGVGLDLAGEVGREMMIESREQLAVLQHVRPVHGVGIA